MTRTLFAALFIGPSARDRGRSIVPSASIIGRPVVGGRRLGARWLTRLAVPASRRILIPMSEGTMHPPRETRPTDRVVEGCSLCEELHGMGLPLPVRLGGAIHANRILLEAADWVVVPSLGPLTAGHSMLVPRTHVGSIAAWLHDRPARGETAVELVLRAFATLYGRPILYFEHGTPCRSDARLLRFDRSAGACIDHAHLHICPMSRPEVFIRATMFRLPEWTRFSSVGAACRGLGPESAYHLMGMTDGPGSPAEVWARPCLEPVPSQLLRQRLAVVTGAPQLWDWRRHPGFEAMNATIATFRGHERHVEAGS